MRQRTHVIKKKNAVEVVSVPVFVCVSVCRCRTNHVASERMDEVEEKVNCVCRRMIRFLTECSKSDDVFLTPACVSSPRQPANVFLEPPFLRTSFFPCCSFTVSQHANKNGIEVAEGLWALFVEEERT